jgi:hypothetical protein
MDGHVSVVQMVYVSVVNMGVNEGIHIWCV